MALISYSEAKCFSEKCAIQITINILLFINIKTFDTVK